MGVFTAICAPGMMYVSDRKADSICETALLFLVMNSEYMPRYCDGSDRTSEVFCVACRYMAAVPVNGGSVQAWKRVAGMPSCRVEWRRTSRPRCSRGVVL